MDNTGFGELYDQSLLENAMKCKTGIRVKTFSFEKFRYAAILSGCDYLKNLPGIGLVKAWNFMNITENPNIRQFLTKIPRYLNMPNLKVDNDYINGFIMADMAFKYQLVFDPRIGKRIPLTNVTDDVLNDADYQIFLSNFPARNCKNDVQLALGNVDGRLRVYDDYNPQHLLRSVLFNKMSSFEITENDEATMKCEIDNRSPLKEIKQKSIDAKTRKSQNKTTEARKRPQSESDDEEDLLSLYRKPFKRSISDLEKSKPKSENEFSMEEDQVDDIQNDLQSETADPNEQSDSISINESYGFKSFRIKEPLHIKKNIESSNETKAKRYKFVKLVQNADHCSAFFGNQLKQETKQHLDRTCEETESIIETPDKQKIAKEDIMDIDKELVSDITHFSSIEKQNEHIIDIDNESVGKEDITDVDNESVGKEDITDVDNELVVKEDITDVDNELVGKEDIDVGNELVSDNRHFSSTEKEIVCKIAKKDIIDIDNKLEQEENKREHPLKTVSRKPKKAKSFKNTNKNQSTMLSFFKKL